MEQADNYQVVCFGEMLWDLLPDKALPGGAPMNVAYHLKKLGTNPAMISKIGTDKYGEGLVNLLASNGITTKFLQVDYTFPTGLVFARLNETHDVSYDIVYPSAWDYILWQDDYAPVAGQADFIVFGSLTSRSKASKDTLYQLLEKAKVKVLDINLRPPHFKTADIENLLRQADVVKMNKAELELIAGWYGRPDGTDESIRMIQDRFYPDTMIITMGGDGAVVNSGGHLYRHPGFPVEVADTIGSGDAFLAGFLHQLLQGSTIKDALEFACGVGAYVATQSGACPDYHSGQVKDLIHSYSGSRFHKQSEEI